jgi:hypothetical protein
MLTHINILFLEQLQKEWVSPVYAFFKPVLTIRTLNGCPIHEFKCSARGCWSKIRCYLDTKDVQSTSNMQKHVKTCWGKEVLDAADAAKDAMEVRTKIVHTFLRNGSITKAFEWKNKHVETYSHQQHTPVETR